MVLVVGGTIPSDDIPELKELGVAEVFTPGAPVQGIIDFIQGLGAEHCARRLPIDSSVNEVTCRAPREQRFGRSDSRAGSSKEKLP